MGRVLVTGCAGFIGFYVAKKLVEQGKEVVGLDNLNEYYDPNLKKARLSQLMGLPGFRFTKMDLCDREAIAQLFREESFEKVLHLAAQAGVRYSLTNPHAYVDANLVGFSNILESCRHSGVKHLVFASSSSVYGAGARILGVALNDVDFRRDGYGYGYKSYYYRYGYGYGYGHGYGYGYGADSSEESDHPEKG